MRRNYCYFSAAERDSEIAKTATGLPSYKKGCSKSIKTVDVKYKRVPCAVPYMPTLLLGYCLERAGEVGQSPVHTHAPGTQIDTQKLQGWQLLRPAEGPSTNGSGPCSDEVSHDTFGRCQLRDFLPSFGEAAREAGGGEQRMLTEPLHVKSCFFLSHTAHAQVIPPRAQANLDSAKETGE